MIALRLLIDTNIVVSAALKPDGLQRTLLILAITKPATLYPLWVTTYDLTNISQNVPDATLFQAPAGYTITEQTGAGGRGGGGRN